MTLSCLRHTCKSHFTFTRNLYKYFTLGRIIDFTQLFYMDIWIKFRNIIQNKFSGHSHSKQLEVPLCVPSTLLNDVVSFFGHWGRLVYFKGIDGFSRPSLNVIFLIVPFSFTPALKIHKGGTARVNQNKTMGRIIIDRLKDTQKKPNFKAWKQQRSVIIVLVQQLTRSTLHIQSV